MFRQVAAVSSVASHVQAYCGSHRTCIGRLARRRCGSLNRLRQLSARPDTFRLFTARGGFLRVGRLVRRPGLYQALPWHVLAFHTTPRHHDTLRHVAACHASRITLRHGSVYYAACCGTLRRVTACFGASHSVVARCGRSPRVMTCRAIKTTHYSISLHFAAGYGTSQHV